MDLNARLIEAAIPSKATCIGGMDCTFIPKSGKATYGLDGFYNGSANRTQKGLEISVIALIDVEAHRGYSLSVKQTPAQLATDGVKAPRPSKRVPPKVVEHVQTLLEQLPDKTGASTDGETVAPNSLALTTPSNTSKTVMLIYLLGSSIGPSMASIARRSL